MPRVSLSELIGQPEAGEFLRRSVQTGRLANAYSLHGPTGGGKGAAALPFARAVLCERRGKTAEVPDDDACGACPACSKAGELQHPDLKFLFPVSGEERELDTSVADTLEQWRQDPLFVFSYEKAASIRISLTRELLRELAFKPYEAESRVLVVRGAGRVREVQA